MSGFCWCTEGPGTPYASNDVADIGPHPITSEHGIGWRPDYIVNSMITIRERIHRQHFARHDNVSLAGFFDMLPIEIMHSILDLLDFRSLSRLSSTCLSLKLGVESFPAYQTLTEHASTALIALNRTKLLPYHTAGAIFTALKTEGCISCGKFAPFLSIITCERACYNCLQRKKSLRVIDLQTARTCFGLSTRDLRSLPSMLSIPGRYSVGHTVTTRRPVKLVSLKRAKELAIYIHGSQDAMQTVARSRIGLDVAQTKLKTIEWLSRPSEDAPFTVCANVPNDPYCGMASTVFPMMRSDGTLEHGLWCRGCRKMSENYYESRPMDPDLVSLMGKCDPFLFILGMEREARSSSQFIVHIGDCKGVKMLEDTAAS